MIKTLQIFRHLLANKKGHNEFGIAPYMVLASVIGFVAMRIRLLTQRKG